METAFLLRYGAWVFLPLAIGYLRTIAKHALCWPVSRSFQRARAPSPHSGPISLRHTFTVLPE